MIPRLLLVALIAAAIGRARAAGLPCRDGYHGDFKQTWNVARNLWNKRCDAKKGQLAEDLLAALKKEFIESCVKSSAPSVQLGLISENRVGALCSEGVTGKARIPMPPEPPGGSDPNDFTQIQAQVSKNIEQASRRVAAINNDVSGKLGSKNIPAIYSERAPKQVADGVYAGKPAPHPLTLADASPAPAPQGRLRIKLVPLPQYANDQRRTHIKAILDLVVSHGSSQEAVTNTKEVIGNMLGRADPDIVKRLANSGMVVEIIPKDKKLTDLAAFRHLKGKKTFDGRVWDNVRGIGGGVYSGGKVFCALPEENMVGNGGHYPLYYVLVHEFGHMVLSNGLPNVIHKTLNWLGISNIRGPTRWHVYRVYTESMKRVEKTGLGNYADSNSREMFAEGTAAFFNTYNGGKVVVLKKKNMKLYNLLEMVYGEPRNLKP